MKINMKRQKDAINRVTELMNDAKNVLIIHYSCESFYDRPDGSSPKITSIAVRKLNDGQTRCFLYIKKQNYNICLSINWKKNIPF